MCVYSMVADDWNKRIVPQYPWLDPTINPGQPHIYYPPTPAPTQEQFDALRKEVEALKKLLKAAKIYDEETGQPDCETEEKIGTLKKIAKLLGVDLNDALPND
jgi:hypothetical protein